MTESSGTEPAGRTARSGWLEDGGPVLGETEPGIFSMTTMTPRPARGAQPVPQPNKFGAVLGFVGGLGLAASTSGLIYTATKTSEPLWRWSTVILLVSLGLAITTLGMGTSAVIQRRELIGTARAAGSTLEEFARLRGKMPAEELIVVQRLRALLYAAGARREGADLSLRVAVVMADLEAKPHQIAEEPW